VAPNMTNLPLVDMTPGQFRDWIRRIAEHSLFADREQLLALLTIETDRETLAEAFRADHKSGEVKGRYAVGKSQSALKEMIN
jgi:hypothetical protein